MYSISLLRHCLNGRVLEALTVYIMPTLSRNLYAFDAPVFIFM